MKPKTSELLKFKRLSRRLAESIRGTVGLLELLWIGTAKNCPEGDIGRFTNEEIAIMCDWDGDPDAMVSALAETGWLDPCSTHRLVVHDWREHAPDYIKGNLAKHGRQFAIAACPQATPQQQLAPSTPAADAPSFPFPSLPYKSIDRLERTNDSGEVREKIVTPEIWDEMLPNFKRTSEILGKGKPLSKRNRDTVIRGVIVAKCLIGQEFLGELLQATADGIRDERVKNPFSYFKGSLIRECTNLGMSFHRESAALRIPEHLLNPPKAQPP
jgi:hypothetical protein